jgi:syntaxin-binding protein 1
MSDCSSLIELQRNYILGQIKAIIKDGGLYILIIDDKTELILNKLISKDQLLRIVTSIEKIDARRKSNKFMEAIYFVESSIYNFRCIMTDSQFNRYKSGNSLFLPIANLEIDYFFNQKFIRNFEINNYFNQGLNIHFIHASLNPVESQVFLTTTNPINSMPIYYNENCHDFVLDQVKKVGESLVNLMIITGEYPLIRFYHPKNSNYQASRLSELIADEFQNQIDEYAREHIDFPPVSNKPRSILLIVDRTLDLFAPLLHEFSYQALAMDIVPSLEREGIYNYKSENEQGELVDNSVTLDNENDSDWINLRHMHIIEASELIINKINDLIKKNPLLIDRSKASTSSDLMYIVANLKGFDQDRKQITLHKTLIDECLEINATRKLAEYAADFEQTCAANGTSFEGVRSKNLQDDLIVLLARQDLHINDKMRLVLIYGLYRGGLIESDFIKLVKFIGVNDKQIVSLISRCFNNLYKLGYPIVKKDIKSKKVDVEMFHTINNEGTYNTSRFSPGVRNILQRVSKHQLDEEIFPYFRDKPLQDAQDFNSNEPNLNNSHQPASLRNHRIKASWATPSAKAGNRRPKQRVFCYVAGGMTYSEIKSIYQLSTSLNKEFYIGSECILKPRDFLIGLQSIDKAKSLQDLNLQPQDVKIDPPEFLYQPDQQLRPMNPTHASFTYGQAYPIPPNQSVPTPMDPSIPSHFQRRSSSNSFYQLEEKLKKKNRLKRMFK